MMNDYYLYHAGVKGMKWGVRRYQNKDGTLTDAGRKRYARESGKGDPDSWVKDDRVKTNAVLTSSKKLTDNTSTLLNAIPGKKTQKMDLSQMSDAEMRTKINRELLERQYEKTFNPPKVSKGKEAVLKALEVGGSILAVGSSALGIALAIKELRGSAAVPIKGSTKPTKSTKKTSKKSKKTP